MSRRPFVGLTVAEAFSVTGSRLSQIAVPWLVLAMTHSPTWTGVAGFCTMLPYVVAKALGGPLTDRLGAKRVAVTADSLSAVAIGSVPLLHWAGMLTLATLLPAAALMGLLRGPADGAKAAMIPQVAHLANVPLERVTGVTGTIERLGSSLGAAVAGGLVALVGPASALLVDAVGLTIAIGCIAASIPGRVSAASPSPATRATPATQTRRSAYFSELADGWRFLRADAVLVGITMMVAATNLLDQAWSAVLVPVWAVAHGHSVGTVGLIFAVMSGAAIGGAAVATAAAARLPRLAVYSGAFFVGSLPRFAVLGSASPSWLVLVVMSVSGFAAGFVNPILGAVVFERIPAPLVGRVSSLNTALCWSLIPFGALVGGLLITAWGVDAALWIVGVTYLLVALTPLVRRSFRQFGVRPEHDLAA